MPKTNRVLWGFGLNHPNRRSIFDGERAVQPAVPEVDEACTCKNMQEPQ